MAGVVRLQLCYRLQRYLELRLTYAMHHKVPLHSQAQSDLRAIAQLSRTSRPCITTFQLSSNWEPSMDYGPRIPVVLYQLISIPGIFLSSIPRHISGVS
ncbi:hypothetical protein BDR04DRAFT_886485 [Suillus decipiens]|nr:hypothetical protein BDR04DRAFT_886485 [Suillus decipiens]